MNLANVSADLTDSTPEIPCFAMDALLEIKAKRSGSKKNTPVTSPLPNANNNADTTHSPQRPSLHLRSTASNLQNQFNSSLYGDTPLFETLEATFADIPDSEDEFLDDDDIDDVDYEYDTDENWESKSEDENENENENNIVTPITKISETTPHSPNTLSVTKSYDHNSLTDYKHFKIRSVTIYGNALLPKLRKYQTGKKYEKLKGIEEDKDDGGDEDHCQTKPQSISKRAYIKTEIIETEKSYLKGLNVLLNEFIKPIFSAKMIPRKYEKDVTSIMPMIIKLHRELLDELTLEYNKKEGGNISIVFIKCAAYLRLYIDYIMSYQRILDIFAKHNKNKKLKKFLRGKRKEKKPLTNHLILPIQRVPRYMLLLQQLLDNTPNTHKNYDTIVEALDIVNKVANSINERKREIENMSQCLQVMENLRECNRNIVEPHRRYLAQFLFRKKENQRPREFFVFSDLIIICNIKMKVKMILDMRTIELKKRQSSSTIPNTNTLIMSYLKKMDSIGDVNNETQFTLYTLKGKPIEYETDMDKIGDIIELNELIIKSRLQVWDGDISRLSNDGKSDTRKALQKCGVSQAQQYRNQLETLQRLRVKKDQSLMNVFKKSQVIKGKKNKVLEMLGADQ